MEEKKFVIKEDLHKREEVITCVCMCACVCVIVEAANRGCKSNYSIEKYFIVKTTGCTPRVGNGL